MLTIIHGDDIAASRTLFLQMQGKSPDRIVMEGQDVTLTDLMQVLEGGGLFSETKKIFIEQFITKKKSSGDYDAIIAYLQKQENDADIVLWEGKELERSSLNLFKTAAVRQCKLPQSLFTFLDALRPGNAKRLLELYHQTLETVEEEAVFYMLVKQIRTLITLQERDDNPIEEIKRMQAWQKDKLLKQSKQFSKEQLIHLYAKLFEIEVGQKTGTKTLPVRTSIDIFLLGI